MKIAILGGTGDLGEGLAFSWARLGHEIIIGSRKKEKAEKKAKEINEFLGINKVQGQENEKAVNGTDLIVLAIPGQERASFLQQLERRIQGQVVLDVTIPLKPGRVFQYDPPPAGSNAQETQEILGEKVEVVAGFHTVSAGLLQKGKSVADEDVLVVGNCDRAKETVLQLIQDLGMRGFDAGNLGNAAALEGLTPIIINLNKKYKRKHIGIKISGF